MAITSRKSGRPRRDRLRTMRFVLWAQTLDHVPTPEDIAMELDVGLDSARRWRADWLEARRPAVAS